MIQNLFKMHFKMLLTCLVILSFCALIQFGSFSRLMVLHEKTRYYGADYDIDRWHTSPPVLTELLSHTTNMSLIISSFIILTFLTIMLIEQDYRPNKSIYTLLRLPRPRSRYLLEKLAVPTMFAFIFWGLQFWVVRAQANQYLKAVPEALRPDSSSPWVFNYYRILYPVTEPVWFPAMTCVMCMIPLMIVTAVFAMKGGMRNLIYGILPAAGIAAVVMTINRVPNMWWITPVLLGLLYINGVTLINRGKII